MKLSFARNTRVFVREQGLGKIVGFGVFDESDAPRPVVGKEAPDFYVVQTGAGTTLVRIRTAAQVIRKLIPGAQAPALLRILRQRAAPNLDLKRLIARSRQSPRRALRRITPAFSAPSTRAPRSAMGRAWRSSSTRTSFSTSWPS